MTSNDQYLFERTPSVRYNAYGVTRDTTLKIASGIVVMPVGSQVVKRDVYFGNFFTSGCKPVVVVGLLSNGENKITVSAQGLAQSTPGHEGFRIISINHSGKINNTHHVSWIAVGF
jgi:hypothetical protein